VKREDGGVTQAAIFDFHTVLQACLSWCEETTATPAQRNTSWSQTSHRSYQVERLRAARRAEPKWHSRGNVCTTWNGAGVGLVAHFRSSISYGATCTYPLTTTQYRVHSPNDVSYS